ncbi:MAG: TonB family protein [Planctomycetes bacterium]|nr:TonB family protein [Planctomycetota bacterium]
MRESREETTLREVCHGLLVVVVAAMLTVAVFFVLPFMETISRPPETDLTVQDVDTVALPPPPPPAPPEPEKEPEPEDEKPPELTEQAEPLDLSQLELALNPGSFGDGLVGDFAVKLNTVTGASSDGGSDDLFSLADLDQKPRVLHNPSPVMDAATRRRAPGTVTILFLVDPDGRVENPIVQAATDPVFEKPALAAIRQWRFEPGRRNGKPVRFRMKIPITFPAGR